jgi:hypothetical protein
MFSETISAEHELRHPASDDPAYNESTYYNFTSPATGVAGWVRVAVQPNQAAGQATALVYLPTGDIVFAFERTGAVACDSWCIGPISVDIVEPLRRQEVVFDGVASVLSDGRAMENPGSALRAAARRPTVLRLSVTDVGAPFGTSGDDPSTALEESMAIGHYEQFCRSVGDITVGEQTYRIEGGGLRDHSWGPRDWTGPVDYRWVVAAMEDGSGLMVLDIHRRDGQRTTRGAACSGGEVGEASVSDVSVQWTPDGYCREIQCQLRTEQDAITLVGTASDGRFMPLRHRRRAGDGAESISRIAYAPYEFVASDGRRGFGIVEALDQMIDGRPSGMAVDHG